MRYAHFRIDRNDFLRGQNSYDDYPNGAVLFSSYGMNPYYKPGLLTSTPDLTDKTTGLQRWPAISTCFNTGSSVGNNAMAVGNDNTQNGYFYGVADDGTFTLKGAADTTRKYSAGFTDSKYYQGFFYTTSKTDIAQNILSMASGSRIEDYWHGATHLNQTALNSIVPHPMVVYGDILYIMDGSMVHHIDGVTPAYNVLDLENNRVITAAAVYRNLIFMAAEGYINAGGALHGQGKLLTWDGYSASWLDEWEYDLRIDAMVVFENILFVFTPKYMGYFDGSRIKPLRPLTAQVFPSMITIVDNSMVYADGQYLVRYGAPIPGGSKIFTQLIPTLGVIDGSQYFSLLAYQNRELIVTQNSVTNANGKSGLVSDINAPSASTGYSMTFNARSFSEQLKLRKITIEAAEVPSPSFITVDVLDDQNYAHSGGTLSSTEAVVRKEIKNIAIRATRTIKPRITVTKAALLRSVDLYFEASEVPITK